MSKYDSGKHVLGHDGDGSPMLSKKRLDSQSPSKQLQARISAYEETKRSVKENSEGFNKPGSQQKRSK